MPALRHLMSMNFSAPRSAPKPASVTTISANFIAVLVAMTVLQPWAMLANGPPWMNTGLFSSVWTRFGLSASFDRAAIAPWALRSRAKMGVLSSRLQPTRMLPNRSRSSLMELDRHRIAMTSEAAMMSKPSWRGKPLGSPPKATTTSRKARSFISMTRFQWIFRKSRSSPLPW